jgi:hypothetical protein
MRNVLAPLAAVCYRGRLIVLIPDNAHLVAGSRHASARTGRRLLWLGAALFCAALVMVAQPVQAVDLQFNGEYRVRGFDLNNFFDARSGGNAAGGCGTPPGPCNDHERFADQRFRLTTTASAGITSGVVTLDFLNTFAGSRPPGYLTGPAVGGSTTGDYRFGTAGLGGSLNAIGLREAYLKFSFPNGTLIAGRHHLVLGHSIIFDDVADGFTAALPLPFWHSQLSVSALEIFNDNAAMPFGSGNNTNLYLVHLQMNPSPAHAFSVYGGVLRDRGPTLLNGLIYGLVDSNGNPIVPAGTNISSATGIVYLMGVSYDAQVGSSTFSFEVDSLSGSISNIPGITEVVGIKGYDVMAAQKIDLGPVTVGLLGVYVTGSGRDDFGQHETNLSDISPNFVLGNILSNGEAFSDRDGSSLQNGGFRGGTNQGGAGLVAFKLSASGDVAPGLNLEGAAIYAATVNPVVPAPICPTPSPGNGCFMDTRLGWELDLNAAYQIDQNLQMKAGAGMLLADNAFSGLYNNNFTNHDYSPITKLFFKVTYRF